MVISYNKEWDYFVSLLMKFRRCILLILLVVGVASAIAENVKIAGKVRDNEDKPLEFATVRIAGTAIGTNTDLSGDYSLTVAKQDTIEVVFSCVGFKTVN